MNAIIEKLNSAGSLFIDFSAAMFVQASILILILLAADFLLRKRVRAVFRYCIWLLVLVKLIIPTSISSPISIGNLFGDKLSEIKINQTETPSQIEQAETEVKVPRLAIAEPKPELYKEIDPARTHLRSLEWQKEQAKVIETSTAEVDEQQKPVAASVSITRQGTAFLAWAVVSLIFILLLIQRAVFVKGLVAQADEITGGLNGLVQSCGKLVSMKGKVKLKTSANATSPAVCGLFRPVILLPQNLAPNLTKEQLKAVLVHELIHIKRGDLWINLFQALLQIAYFYNPFVWLANAITRRAREQAVDETVQVALGKSAESYPQILVNVAKLAFKKPALSLRLIGVVENKSALKNRIARMLSRPTPKKAKLGLIGFIFVFVAAAVLLPMAAARSEKSITTLDKSKFEATLSNGVTVELVGTCQYTEEGVNCYRPDGLPLGKGLKIAKWNQRPEAGDIGFMFKVDGPEDMSLWYHGIEGAERTEASCDVIDENGQKLEGWEAVLTKLDDDQMTTTAKFGAAAGAWKTVAEHDGRSIKIVNGVSFTKAAETEQGVQIFTTDTIGRNVTQRIVAIDKDGQLHPWRGHTGSVSNSQIRQSIGTFPSLKLDQIEKFQFQTRPYEWVEFKNVSVKPNFKTDVQIEVKTPGNSIKGHKPGDLASDRLKNVDRIAEVTFKKGTSIRDVLRFIASKYKKNIIISDKVSGQVPITELYDVTFEELLEAVLGTHKYVVDGNFIRVYTAEEFDSLYPNLKTDVQIETEGEENEQPLGTLIIPGQGVGGLTFGMSKDDVIERLGEPKSLINRREGYSLYYDGICFNIVDNKVNTIDVLSPYYKFENGLGIGDSELKIIQTFGSDFYLDKHEGKDFLTYKNKGLIFEIFKSKRTVMEITVMKAENNYRSKFLETIPEFRDLHLGMTEREFQNQIKRFPVYANRTEQEDGHIRYHLFAKNGENIIVGFSNGVCGGIQRMTPIPILGADNEWEQAVEDSANLEYSDVNIGVWGWTHKDEGWKGNVKSITAIEVKIPGGQDENSNVIGGIVTVKQRDGQAIPGTDGKLEIHIGDITAGRVQFSLTENKEKLVIPQQSVKADDILTFEYDEQLYYIKVVKLINYIVGEDEAIFEISAEKPVDQIHLFRLIESAKTGQTVTIPRGVYSVPILVNKSLTLKGEDANDCIIEVTADEPAVFVDTKGKGRVTIENLTVKWQLATSDKNIERPFAVCVKDTKVEIKNCNFVPLGNYQRSPVALRAQGFTNMDVNNCRFEGYNYTVQFGDGTEGILQNSVIANSGHQGVTNYSGSTLRVKGNIITGSKFHAVRCTGGKIYLEDNLLINNENRGIYLGSRSASGTITNNVIIGNGTNISGFARSQVSITNNIIADSSYAGISMRDSCRLSIANNIFQNNTRGIILHEEAGKNTNRISKNTFWKNAVNFENIERFAPPIEAEPSLVDPNNGDFSLKSGPVREQNQGLKQPEVFKALWEKFKKLKAVKSDF